MSRQVYAHYMVGLTDGQAVSQWQKDVNDAKAVGIDGFALNIGPNDSWTLTQLHNAYSVAEAANFKMFISFDMQCCGDWNTQSVIDIINTFKGSSSQVKVNNLPMVSTFEGPNWGNWGTVRSSTGGISLVPDWSSLGPYGVQGKLSQVEGAVYWGAWPDANQQKKTSGEDVLYKNVLAGKPYVMGVSPYFYTNLPQWGKNWWSSSESLWYDRWQQVLDIMPEMVEIITWNDYGESSYIGDIIPQQIVSGAEKYVNGYDHKAFRAILPYLIKSYKAGNKNVDLPFDPTAIAWYRTTPAHAGSDGGTIWGQGGGQSAANGAKDVVSVQTITVNDVDIKVCIGSNCDTYRAKGSVNHVNFFEKPFNGATGAVTISMNGKTTTGPSITNNLPSTGYVNWNSVAIQV
ncbi:Fc.00g045150.m01.CDS01 [Cosmosporella sp. VM-42]